MKYNGIKWKEYITETMQNFNMEIEPEQLK